MELSESEDNLENGNSSMNESDSDEDNMLGSDDDQEREVNFTKHIHNFKNQYLLSEQIPVIRD